MAFGTRGDVYPIAAIAASFAHEKDNYIVVLITHSAHQDIAAELALIGVTFIPVSSPPVLAAQQHKNFTGEGFERTCFGTQKMIIQEKHRKECLSAIEAVFENNSGEIGDFVLINFFALEGWHLAELFDVQCVVASPYVVPYSAPSSFELKFKELLPDLYEYFKEAPENTVCWADVLHWMWPLFMETWERWRYNHLNLSAIPFTDPVTNIPLWHMRKPSPLLMYGFSKEIVEQPGYWPPGIRICGFWFLPLAWQFSCHRCKEIYSANSKPPASMNVLCANHVELHQFLVRTSDSRLTIFVGFSSIGSMGFLTNPVAFVKILKATVEKQKCKFILFTSEHRPLEVAIQETFGASSSCCSQDSSVHMDGQIFCFTGTLPYSWLFPRCDAVIHHAGSGSTATALHAGIPQVLCPFVLDQFYWAERLHWLGVAPEPLQRQHLFPDRDDDQSIDVGVNGLTRAIKAALSPEIKLQAARIADKLSTEDGKGEALEILKEISNGS